MPASLGCEKQSKTESTLRHQRRGHWCGIASIANALEVLGIRRTQREIAKLIAVTEGTPDEDEEEDKADDVYDPGGADEIEMKRALLANGCDVEEWHSPDLKPSIRWLRGCLEDGLPVVLCVDASDHWVTALGVCGNRVIVFDPSRNTGIEVHGADTLAERWLDQEDGYYGLALSKEPP